MENLKKIKSMKTKKIAVYSLLVVIFFTGMITSCEKSGSLYSQDVGQIIDSQQTKASKSMSVYYVSQIYKDSYKHIKQGYRECSWTSYVLAATSVARAEGQDYPYQLTTLTVDKIKEKIGHVKTTTGSNAIASIRDYAKNTDKPVYSTIKARLEPYTSFDSAVFGLLGERKNNGNKKPCIFITSSNGRGHYVIIWDIMWGGTATTSYVNITDPLDGTMTSFSTFDQRKKEVNLQTLINGNVMNNYNFLYFD